MHTYFVDIAKEYKIDIKAIGGICDHIHVLFSLPPKLSVATVVRTLKANSSKWMNEIGHLFAWQEGYGLFSVSVSNLEAVSAYIARQEEHHRNRCYQEEFAEFLRKHGIVTKSGKELD